MAKTKSNKGLIITSIILTVIMLVGLVFSVTLWKGVEDLLHPETTQNETDEDTSDASEQVGQAFAAVFVGILLIPIWILAELLTVIFTIPSIVMTSTLCGRLARDRRDKNMPNHTVAMLVTAIVLLVINIAAIAVIVTCSILV